MTPRALMPALKPSAARTWLPVQSISVSPITDSQSSFTTQAPFKSSLCLRVCFFQEITTLSTWASTCHPARTAYLKRIKVLER